MARFFERGAHSFQQRVESETTANSGVAIDRGCAGEIMFLSFSPFLFNRYSARCWLDGIVNRDWKGGRFGLWNWNSLYGTRDYSNRRGIVWNRIKILKYVAVSRHYQKFFYYPNKYHSIWNWWRKFVFHIIYRKSLPIKVSTDQKN